MITASNESIPKAQFSWFADYYFTEYGIVRVPILSPFIAVVVLLIFILSIRFFLSPILLATESNSLPILLIDGLAPLVFASLTLLGIVHLKRTKLSALPVDELRFASKGTKVIPWKDVETIELKSRNRVTIVSNRRTLTMQAGRKDTKSIREFASRYVKPESALSRDSQKVVSFEGRNLVLTILGFVLVVLTFSLVVPFLEGNMPAANAYGAIAAILIIVFAIIINAKRTGLQSP